MIIRLIVIKIIDYGSKPLINIAVTTFEVYIFTSLVIHNNEMMQ